MSAIKSDGTPTMPYVPKTPPYVRSATRACPGGPTEIDPSDFPRAIEAMRQAFIDSYPEPADDDEETCIMNLADKFSELARIHLLPIHNALLAKFVSARASNSAKSVKSAKPTANPPHPLSLLSEIPPTSKQLHAHTVWQKAKNHGLIPADSVYQIMCPDEASKKRFYNQYVLKIISIDEGAAKAVLENIKKSTDAAFSQASTSEISTVPPVKRVKSLNHMQLFRIDFCEKNPNASVAEIRDAWSKLAAKEQQAYMIKAAQS